MSINLEEQWDHLEGSSGSDDGYRLSLLTSTNAVRIYAAYSPGSKRPGVLIEMPADLKPVNLAKQNSRKIEIIDNFSGLPQERYALGIMLIDLDYKDLFIVLISDILEKVAAAASSEKACAAAVVSIMRWRIFLEKRSAPLTEFEVRGLIGELIILSRLTGKVGVLGALEGWTGPLKAVRDFELQDYTVEVKTCVPTENATVTISMPEQLEAVDVRPVYLAVVQVARSESEGSTLPEFVDETGRLFAASLGDGFYDKLAGGGYLAGHAPLYTTRYVVNESAAYGVQPGFPRISASDVPAGVARVKFDIAVAALRPFLCDASEVLGPI